MIIFVILAFSFGIFLGYILAGLKKGSGTYAGEIIVETTDTGTKLYSLQLNGDPEELDQKDSVIFKIIPVRT